MSQDKKQAVAAGDFDPARDIMFRLQDFWFKYKNVVIVVVILVVAGLVFYVNKQNAEKAKTEAASTAFSLAMNTVEIKKDTVKGIEMLAAVYDEHQGTFYARYSAYAAAQLYLTQGNAEKAIEWFDYALATKGKDIIVEPEATEGKAIALELQDKTAEAKAMYEAVLKMKSHRTKDVSLKLAYLEMKSGNSVVAEKYCQDIIADSLNVTAATYNAQALLAEINATK